MHHRRASLLLLPFTLGLLALAPASPLASVQGPREKSALAQAMGEINGAVRTIPRLLKDEGGRDGALAECLKVERLLLDAKLETPPTVAAIEDPAQRAAEQDHFRREMNALLAGFLELENAILKDDEAALQAAMQKLGELKDHGHADFKPKGRDW